MKEIKKGTEIQGRYVIGDHLGSGGFAIVWRATDKQLGRDVAIKRLTATAGENKHLIDEARRTVKLGGHQNIVQVYDVIQEGDEALLVMEFVDGESLEGVCRRHIRNKTWLDEEEALDIWKQVLEGLVFAHKQQLYHRDIKPSNILVSKLGLVKVVDFGLAKTPDELKKELPAAPGFAWSGTPNFMSPEQANGEAMDQQTDIFSAGLVGYILFTGRHPFNHPSAVASVFELIKDSSFNCPEAIGPAGKAVPENVRSALSKMLCKPKSERYGTVLEALSDLVKEPAQACSRCGASSPLTSRFCSQCGTELGDVEPSGVKALSGASPSVRAEDLTAEGFQLAQKGMWEDAIKKYREAIDLNGNHGLAYTNLGFALNRTGQFQKAIDVLTKATKLTTADVHLYKIFDIRGFSKLSLKDYEGAVSDFTEALSFTSRDPRVYVHRAQARAELGDYQKALQDIEKALRLDPENHQAIRLRRKLSDEGIF
jgi:serine/threonine protein kinase